MNSATVVLSPAQAGFLSQHVPGFSIPLWTVSLAGQAGSPRQFLRVKGPDQGAQPLILVVWDSADNDWPRFLNINAEVSQITGALPRLLAHDDRHGLILEEDLGDMTLCQFCAQNRSDRAVVERTYQSVIDELIAWQRIPPSQSPSLAARAMDEEMFLWETEYFASHCVTKYFGCEHLLDRQWQDERARLARATAAYPRVPIHRDFQSENIMLHRGAIRFVDYQGARLGTAGYDLASLLFDPYVDMLDASLVSGLLAVYQNKTGFRITEPEFAHASLQRLMQALGAYANLSLNKGKDRYRAFIPLALQRLEGVLAKTPEFGRTREIVRECRARVG